MAVVEIMWLPFFSKLVYTPKTESSCGGKKVVAPTRWHPRVAEAACV